MRSGFDSGGEATAAAVEADTPLVLQIVEQEIRQPLTHRVDLVVRNRGVTAIEVQSPDDKPPTPGRNSCLRKRDELSRSEAHLVEIDLLQDSGRRLSNWSTDRLGVIFHAA